MIEADQNLSKLFAMGNQDNELISRFREELLSDLYNLVEIVLLEKNTDFRY